MTADISKYQEHREKLAKAMVFICDQAGIDSEDYKKLQMESLYHHGIWVRHIDYSGVVIGKIFEFKNTTMIKAKAVDGTERLFA